MHIVYNHITILCSIKAVFLLSALFLCVGLFWSNNASAETGIQDCSSDLLGLDVVVQNLSVPENLCIRYVHSRDAIAWRYSRDFAHSSGIYIHDGELAKAYSTSLLNPQGWKQRFYTRYITWRSKQPAIEIYTNRIRTTESMQYVLLHELCHANQNYYQNSIYQSEFSWYITPSGRDFIDIVGYSVKNGKFYVSSYPYNEMYNDYPRELAAEVCVAFLRPSLLFLNAYGDQLCMVITNKRLQEWFEQYVAPISESTWRLIRMQKPGCNDKPEEIVYNENGDIKEKIVYDFFGMKIYHYHYSGNLVILTRYNDYNGTNYGETRRLWERTTVDGVLSWNIIYDRDKEAIRSVEVYDENGVLESIDRYAQDENRTMTEYYHAGKVSRKRYYDTNGMVLYEHKH